jgi:hypothetical protein
MSILLNGRSLLQGKAKAILSLGILPPTPTPTITPTITPTPSTTPQNTPTNTLTPTQTNTASVTAAVTNTPTLTQTPSNSPTQTSTQTQTVTPSITASQTQTPTPSITSSQTQTPTPSITASQTQTQTTTQTPTPSITTSQTQTPTPTNTLTPTVSPTPNLTSSGLIGYYDLYNSEIPDGFDSGYDACSGTTTIYNITLYWNGDFDDGTTLYEDNQGLTLFRNTTFGYYYYSGNTFNLEEATVYNIESCVLVTPTPTQSPTVTQTVTPTTTTTPTPTSNASFHFVLLPIDTVCYNYNYVNNSGSSSVLKYMDCNGNTQSVNVINGGSGTFCAQRGALISTPLDSITITETTSCGTYNPTPTPTATNTPTPTIGSCVDCREITFDGNITHASLTAYWTSCDGLPQSYFVNADTTYGPVCAILGTASGQAFTTGPSCGNSCPTPTITPTKTATPTPTATPFPSTGFQTSAFTSNAISQTTGQYQIICQGGDINKKVQGYIFVSNNYGANFTGVRIPAYWRTVGVSDDGQYMLAAGNDGTNPFTYKSSDYGVTWVQIPNNSFPAPPNYYTNNIYTSTVAISNNGQYQVIGTDLSRFTSNSFGGGYELYFCIYVSNDYGSTWSLGNYQLYSSSLFGLYSQVTISANGQIILATASGGITDVPYGQIYRSSNYGASFTAITSTLTANNGTSISISRDGGYAVASFGSSQSFGFLKYSQDSGTTWNNITNGSTPNRTWSSVATYDDAVSGTTAYATTTTSSNLVRVMNLETTPVITEVSPTKNCRFRLSVSNSGQYIIVRDTVGIWRSANYGSTFNYITS